MCLMYRNMAVDYQSTLFKQGQVIKLLLNERRLTRLRVLKAIRALLAVVLCLTSTVVYSDRMFFTSNLYTDYAHTVARMLVQKLFMDSYRTVGRIHLEEIPGRNNSKTLRLSINGTETLNYQYSLARRSNNLPEEQVAANIVNRLVAEKKAVRTQN